MNSTKPKTCGSCWWADYNEQSPTRHKLHHEPNLFGMSDANKVVKDIRVIKVCGKNEEYFKAYGSETPVPCPNWANFGNEKAKFEDHVAQMRNRWRSPTNRQRLPRNANGFAMITIMWENSNDEVWGILSDFVALGDEGFAAAISSLNDMNLRGRQIAIAMKFVGNDVGKIVTADEAYRQKIVDHVNETYRWSDNERAVTSGAHLYGHKLTPKKKEK